MKFHGQFKMLSAPCLWGKSNNSKSYHHESSCHEFCVGDVEVKTDLMKFSSRPCPLDQVPSKVSFIAGEYSKNFLHGPASSRTSKSIVYPCNRFQCRIDCPCHLCRFKSIHCTVSNKKCEDCELCKKDYNDHMLHHRAYHLQCEFCQQLHRIFPRYTYTVVEWEYSYRTLEDEPVGESKAYIFAHVYSDHLQQDQAFGPFRCDNCSKSFARKADLKRHEVTKHYALKHLCHQCGENFSREDNLRRHVAVIHNKKDVCFICPKCDESFSNEANYQRHVAGSINEKGSSKHSCGVCQRNFCTAKKLAKHAQTHVSFKCENCEKTFSSKQRLQTHVANREEKKCNECDNIFCNQSALNSHLQDHKFPYVECTLCGNRYLKTSIANHVLMSHTHTH